jgi:hypothetical protein
MKLPLLVLFTVLTADAAAAARPVSPAIQQIRARYQQVLEALERAGGQAPFTMAVNPADSSSKASVLVSFAAPDGFDVESNDQTLQLARVVETWSNLGPQTSEYLYDPQGELLFHYTQIALDGTRRKELRLWFDKGAVIRVQDGASVIDTPVEAHQAQGARAKLAAQKWLGWYRDLRAVRVALP